MTDETPMSAKDYRKNASLYRETRDTHIVTVPSGATFKVVLIRPFEATLILKAMGMTIDDFRVLRENDKEEVAMFNLKAGMNLMDAAEDILPKYVIVPRVIRSTAYPTPSSDGNALMVRELEPEDIDELMSNLINQALGTKGARASKNFRGPSDNGPDSNPGKNDK